MEAIPVLTDFYTGVPYNVPRFQLDAVTTPTVTQIKTAVNNRQLVVGETSWDTQRLTQNSQWTIRFPAVFDDQSEAMTTSRLKSLFMGWAASGNTLTFSGVDLLAIDNEIMRDIGDTTRYTYRTAQPWWATGEVIQVNGVTANPSTYTVNATRGTVTFDSRLSQVGGIDPVVTCTVQREPRVRVMSAPPGPQMGTYPVQYAVEAILFELTPA